MSYKTRSAVLVVVFNRPTLTRKLLNALREVRPPRIYVAADGPREGRPGESERCEETLLVFREIDWKCEVHFLVQEKNRGSHTAIPLAIDWFFQAEERGIVLEDDCIPVADFFRFCDLLLVRHENDENVMWINGSNVGYEGNEAESAYEFSKYAISWGWASWRRAWTMFGQGYREQVSKRLSPELLERRIGYSAKVRAFWWYMFRYAYRVRNWDYRWLYTMWENDGLACTPTVNLVRNEGFGIEAMHVSSPQDPRGNIKARGFSVEIILAPGGAIPSAELDAFLEKKLYEIGNTRIIKLWIAATFPIVRTAYRKLRNRPL